MKQSFINHFALLITVLLRGEPANRRNCQRFTGELGKTEVSEKSG